MSRRLFLLLVLAAVGCGGKPSPDTKPTPEPTPAPTTAANPPADPYLRFAVQTCGYWQDLGLIQELTARKYAALADPKPDEVNKLLTAAAKEVEELTTENVDPDALAVGKGLADAMRNLTEAKPDPAKLTAAAGKARTAKATFATRYSTCTFPPLDAAAAKEPAFRLVRDLGRPTLAQELARLKAEAAKFDTEIKPINEKLTEEITTKDKLQGEADSVRAILKNQTEDADLKKLREEVLADAVKQVEAKKKEIDALSKQVNALRAKKGDLDRLAMEVTGVLIEGEPAKAEKLPLDRLDRLRVLADRVSEKLDAQKK